MTDRQSYRAIAHLARIAVSHLDDGANGNITPALNAALRRLRWELDKTNAGYDAAAPEGAQSVLTETGVVRAALERFDETTADCGEADLPRAKLDGLVAFGYLTRRRAGRYDFEYTLTDAGERALRGDAAPPSLGGEDRALRDDAARYRKIREIGANVGGESSIVKTPLGKGLRFIPIERQGAELDARMDEYLAAARAAEGGERG